MIKNGRRKKRRILLFQAFVTTTKAHGPYILIVYVAQPCCQPESVWCAFLSLEESSATMRNQATATSTSKRHPYMLQVNALRYAKVMFTNTFTHFCLHNKNMTYQFMPPLFMSYILVWVYSHGPMQYIHRLFKLIMLLRLKQPSLIKI